jgi:hypothetical protein
MTIDTLLIAFSRMITYFGLIRFILAWFLFSFPAWISDSSHNYLYFWIYKGFLSF